MVLQEEGIMDITDDRIDAGKAFDWGRISELIYGMASLRG